MDKKRALWADYARGIAILLVHIGHAGWLPRGIHNWIYLFHMPLFFFLTGYFGGHLDDKPIDYIKRRIKTYIIPYFIYEVCYVIYCNILSLVQGNGIVVRPLAAALVQLPGTIFNNDVWFLTALFVTSIMFYYIQRFGKKICNFRFVYYASVAIGIIGFIYHKVIGINLPWYIDVSCLLLPYISLGYYFREKGIVEKLFKRKFIYMGVALIISVVIAEFYIHLIDTDIDYHLGKVEDMILLYLGGVCGIVFLLMACQIIPKSLKLLEFIGKNSLFYYLLDWIGVQIGSYFVQMFGYERNTFVGLVIQVIFAIFVTMPVIMFCKMMTRFVKVIKGIKLKDSTKMNGFK